MRYLLLFFLLSTNLLFSQAFVENNVLKIQGVARDNDNQPRTNESDLSLSFFVYYVNNNSYTFLVSENGTVDTDDFGVFSYELNIPKTVFNEISKFETYVRVANGGTTYSDEKIQTVPYALYAQNGVPTGSIVAYRGTEDDLPSGWLLCDGSRFPDDEIHAQLKDYLGGNNLPDLRGQFLRGTGNYTNNSNKSGPRLNEFQEDAFISHNHPINETTLNSGLHSHLLKNTTWHEGNGGVHYFIGAKRNGANNTNFDDVQGWFTFLPGIDLPTLVSFAPDHTHDFEGDTELRGSVVGSHETRPPNHGVNFIIKI